MSSEGCVEYPDLHETEMRGERLRRRRFKTTGVELGNGEAWQVGGPPLSGEAAGLFENAVGTIDDFTTGKLDMGPRGQITVLRAMIEAAYAILCQCYPALTRPQFDSLVDGAMAQRIVMASLSGATADDEVERAQATERDLATVQERVAWCLSSGRGTAEAIAAIVVNGIPAAPALDAAGNASPPSANE